MADSAWRNSGNCKEYARCASPTESAITAKRGLHIGTRGAARNGAGCRHASWDNPRVVPGPDNPEITPGLVYMGGSTTTVSTRSNSPSMTRMQRCLFERQQLALLGFANYATKTLFDVHAQVSAFPERNISQQFVFVTRPLFLKTLYLCHAPPPPFKTMSFCHALSSGS